MYDGYRKYGENEAREYDVAREVEPVWHAENRFVEEYFQTSNPGRLLDAPVGTGRFLPYYHQVREVVGLDISESMLLEAKSRVSRLGLGNTRLTSGDIFALSYPDAYFDVVVSWRFLHLLPREMLVPALRELRRVASGDVLIQAYLAPGPLGMLIGAVRRSPRTVARLLGFPQKHGAKEAWSHIQAYHHSWETLVSAFVAAEMQVSRRVKLAPYGEGEAVAVVLRRK